MPRITFRGQSYEASGQSLLESLTARGHSIPHGCRAGICQACLMRVVGGTVPPQAQEGLPPSFAARGLFLACRCHPEQDLEVALAEDTLEHFEAKVRAIEPLNASTCALRLQTPARFSYRAGQFLQLYRDEATARCYSLASVPGLDADLELHIQRVPAGRVSNWIFQELRSGDAITISEARGNCYYEPAASAQNILLIGTGSGLAPLYGIARDALNQGHRGRIALYHGSRVAAGLYLGETLRRMAATFPNFRFEACVSEEPPLDAAWAATPLERALLNHPDLAGWRIYLCGNPQMVESARMETFMAGAASSEIFADPFLPTGSSPAASPAIP